MTWKLEIVLHIVILATNTENNCISQIHYTRKNNCTLIK